MAMETGTVPGLRRRQRRFGRPIRAGSTGRTPLGLVDLERRLALVCLWAVLGLFGIGLVLSGFTEDRLALGLTGFALILGAFIASILVNHYYNAEFTSGEVILGLVLLGAFAVVYLLSWILAGGFSSEDRILGAAGFGSLLLAVIVYLITRFGIRRAYYLIHERHD